MPIPLPNLDDRRWADLVDEGRSLIPLYTPEWTNFNVSDPGITLLELFAFIAEMDIYQLNRIPDWHKRKFLELIGLTLRSPKPATTVLSLSLPSGDPPVAVAAGQEYLLGSLAFRTLSEITVAPGTFTSRRSAEAFYLGFSDPLPPGQRVQLYVETAPGERPALDVRWEYLNSQGWWSPLHVTDETEGLAREGPVFVTGPVEMGRQALDQAGEALYYLRLRTPTREPLPVRTVELNAVRVEQASEHKIATVGFGTGAPRQLITLPGAPLVESSLVLQSIEPQVVAWELRTSLDSSTPADAHFLLDAQLGTVIFGDGRRGRVLPEGAELRAGYLKTAGAGGTLNAGAHTSDGDLTVTAILPAAGGADAETLNEGIARAVQEREAPLRAVTLADYEALARATPGVELARVEALGSHHPAFDGVRAPGVVTVLVVPNSTGPMPRADAALRARIHRYLKRRRLIGTRVEVCGPTYLRVTVQAQVRCLPGQSPDRVRTAVTDALDHFLDPLVGGPEKTGWPFGRGVYHMEVLRVIDGVPGVDYVTEMNLLPGDCARQCGDIRLHPTWLVTPGKHQITVL